MHITKIELQKKNKRRFNLYSQDIFLFAVSEDTLVHFHIQKDKEYSDTDLLNIQRYEEIMQCQAQAYRNLSRRPHLAAELSRKLHQKAYPAEIIEDAIKGLKKMKYLDDHDFIKRFISDQIHLKKSGPLAISKKLFGKGANRSDVEEFLSKSYSEELQVNNALYHFEKKAKAKPAPDFNKLAMHLQQKGFSWDIIRQVKDRIEN